MDTIPRYRARDQVRDALRQSIVSGSFRPGERLDEIRLSQQIGASRTPLREALIALEEEGLVQSRPNRGFTVAALDENLVRETYAILGALESAAVETGGDALVAQKSQLESINNRLAREPRPSRRHALDREFHRMLAEPCGNGRLLQLLTTQWNQASRIDGGEKRGIANLAGSCAEHAAIVAAINDSNLEEAARLLRIHWRNGVHVVANWMKEQK
ncbi:MAG: GntR family transcriptional regulator [Rhizomicrobium sp.]|jgi:DNA-binding GntR family transcriptional regulator